MADDVVYLKTDEPVAQFFHERGLDQFQYETHGKMFKLSNDMAPEDFQGVAYPVQFSADQGTCQRRAVV